MILIKYYPSTGQARTLKVLEVFQKALPYPQSHSCNYKAVIKDNSNTFKHFLHEDVWQCMGAKSSQILHFSLSFPFFS